MPRGLNMASTSSTSEGSVRRNWLEYILKSSAEAERWIVEYRNSHCWKLGLLCNQALDLLHAHQIAPARELLKVVESEMSCCTRKCMRHLLERYYYPVLAYYKYCSMDYDGADYCLMCGDRSVRMAIELRYFLMPLADSCVDFRIQRARVARNQGRWAKVGEHLDTARGMLQGTSPFCILGDGTMVMLADLQAFYSSLSLTETERLAVNYLLDDDARASTLERVCLEVYTRVGLVIPYP